MGVFFLRLLMWHLAHVQGSGSVLGHMGKTSCKHFSEAIRQLRMKGMCSTAVPGKHPPLQLTSSRHRSTSALGKVSLTRHVLRGRFAPSGYCPLPPPVPASARAPPMPMLRNKSGWAELSLLGFINFQSCLSQTQLCFL